MKRFQLLKLLPLVAVVFAVACTDATTAPPTTARALLAPGVPSFALRGNEPPPPVDAAMTITVSSSPHIAPFTGVYFSNDHGLGSSETSVGMAWLRLDNKQPMPDAGDASANTRFMVKGIDPPTGMGTLCFGGTGTLCSGGVAFKIVRVDDFRRFSGCNVVGETCAIITFTAETVGGPVCDPNDPEDADCHHGDLTAFNAQNCTIEEFFDQENEESHFEFVCPSSEID